MEVEWLQAVRAFSHKLAFSFSLARHPFSVILHIYMSKMRSLRRASTLALRQRKAHLLRSFNLPPHLLHASLLKRLLKCGKSNCHCHSGGPRHGPFFYLNRSFAKGKFQTFLLKSPEQLDQARQALEAYAQAEEILDEISQLNYELLLRNQPLRPSS